MVDVLSQKQRSYCMSRIKRGSTSPELLLRKALWKEGIRYNLKSGLPGQPDIIIKKFVTVIFVDGCFWHMCPKHFVKPKTREEFWETKISGNVERDKKNNKKLSGMGWTVIRIWEHEIKEDLQSAVDKVIQAIEEKNKSQSV